MFNQNGYSLADMAAAVGNNNGWNNDNSWWLIILFMFCFGGNSGWGNYGYGYQQPATTNEVQNQFNFASLERQNQSIIDSIHQSAYDVTGALKDGNTFTQSMMKDIAYDINGELKDNAVALDSDIRDVKDAVLQNNFEIGQGFAAMSKEISDLKYDNALNTRELLASNCAQTQKILDVLNGNRMADMQNQINNLQLQAALSGVIRYPQATTYTAGYAPIYGGGCCGNNGAF